MKKQFNFYMSAVCKNLISEIRNLDPVSNNGLSDSQIVERLIWKERSSLNDLVKMRVDIKGICDDAYCPKCDRCLESVIDSVTCPYCGILLDWSRYHRIND